MQSSSALGKVFQDGDAIVRQGEQGDGLYVIQSGEVRVIREEDGREVSLTTLGESDFFGEVPFFERVRDPGVVRSTIRAIGEVHIITIDRKTMVRRIHEDPSGRGRGAGVTHPGHTPPADHSALLVMSQSNSRQASNADQADDGWTHSQIASDAGVFAL